VFLSSSRAAAGVAAVCLVYAPALSWGQSDLQARARALGGETRLLEGKAQQLSGSARGLEGAVGGLRGRMRPLRGRVIAGPRDPNRIVVRFKFADATLLPTPRTRLALFARTLDSSAVVRIYVRGHTDSIGGEGYNEGLSIRRAETVCRELRRLLDPKPQCRAQGLGEREPVAHNCTPDLRDNPRGRARNRRAEVDVWLLGRTSASRANRRRAATGHC
jgi:outer membrane protein OmpA-like peptidoglycan-associated protein